MNYKEQFEKETDAHNKHGRNLLVYMHEYAPYLEQKLDIAEKQTQIGIEALEYYADVLRPSWKIKMHDDGKIANEARNEIEALKKIKDTK